MTTTTSTPVQDPAAAGQRWQVTATIVVLAVVMYVFGLLSDAEDGALSRTDYVRSLYPALFLLVIHAVVVLPPGRRSVAWRRYAGVLLVVVPAAGAGTVAWITTSGLTPLGWWCAAFVVWTIGTELLVARRWRAYGARTS